MGEVLLGLTSIFESLLSTLVANHRSGLPLPPFPIPSRFQGMSGVALRESSSVARFCSSLEPSSGD